MKSYLQVSKKLHSGCFFHHLVPHGLSKSDSGHFLFLSVVDVFCVHEYDDSGKKVNRGWGEIRPLHVSNKLRQTELPFHIGLRLNSTCNQDMPVYITYIIMFWYLWYVSLIMAIRRLIKTTTVSNKYEA